MISHETNVIDFTEATLGLIEKADDSQLIDSLVTEADLTPYQALAWTVRVQATGHLPTFRTKGQEAQMLSLWRKHVEHMCSDTYHMLLDIDPEGGREAARQDHHLRKLNAARWGLGAAMRYSAKRARRTAEWDRSEEQSTDCASLLRSLTL